MLLQHKTRFKNDPLPNHLKTKSKNSIFTQLCVCHNYNYTDTIFPKITNFL